jgi:hypothetical protein
MNQTQKNVINNQGYRLEWDDGSHRTVLGLLTEDGEWFRIAKFETRFEAQFVRDFILEKKNECDVCPPSDGCPGHGSR